MGKQTAGSWRKNWEKQPKALALSLSPDDRTKEEQAEAGLPWIKHTPCEPSHATALTPWGHAVTSLSSDACLIAEGRMEMEGANSGYC